MNCIFCGKNIDPVKVKNFKAKYCSLNCVNSDRHRIEQSAKSNLIRQYNKMLLNWSEYVLPNFTIDEYKGRLYEYEWRCKKCDKVFKQYIHSTRFMEWKNKTLLKLPRCFDCYPRIKSTGEFELLDFCKQYYPDLIENDRQLIKPYELDIVIPELKLAIEFNRKLVSLY